MTPRALALVALCACALLAASSGRAERRYALVVGNNIGVGGEPMLRWAEDDARKVAQVLRTTGGFHGEDITVLTGGKVADVRRALLAINDRIREAPGAVMVVYFSGHASAQGLHIDGEELALLELEQFVRGSSATFRVLIVDACRSGALTTVKGGRPAPAFSLASPTAEGYVVLTAAAAGEDAQESEQLRGSFFTHYLTSGLLGAADADADRRVTLEEAYRYAFEATVDSSSKTLAGTQHPTFRYDLRGKGALVLSVLAEGDHAMMRFAEAIDFLVFDGAGGVVAEVSARAPNRTVVVPAGELLVRGRGDDAAFEGKITAVRGQTVDVATAELERFEYARLVRKGIGERRLTVAPYAYVGLGGAPFDPALAVGLSVPFVFRGFTAGPSAQYLVIPGALGISERAGGPPAVGDETGHVVSVDAFISNAWDFEYLSLVASSGVGVSVLANFYGTGVVAPGVNFMLSAGVEVPIVSPLFVRADCGINLGLSLGGSFLFESCAPALGAYF